MTRDREPVEEPLEALEDKQLVGGPLLAACSRLEVEVCTTASAFSSRPAHSCSTLSAERTGVETRSWRARSARRAGFGPDWAR